MDPQETIRSLGLTEKETSLYLASLELGESTVLQLSRKADMKRPTVYVVLQALEERGYVRRIVRGKKVQFAPQHPRKLLTEAELRVKELQEVVPQLESLLNTGAGKPRITIYEGKERLDRAYDEAFITKGEILFITPFNLSADAFPRTFKKFFYMTLSPMFRAREIIDDTEETRAYAEKQRGPYHGIRFRPKELPFLMDVGIFGNRTLISSVKKDYFTVSIESQEVAESFRTMFEMMWLAAKE